MDRNLQFVVHGCLHDGAPYSTVFGTRRCCTCFRKIRKIDNRMRTEWYYFVSTILSMKATMLELK